MENQIPFSDVKGKRKTKMENQFRFPMSQENGKRKWKIKFRFPILQENSWHKGTRIDTVEFNSLPKCSAEYLKSSPQVALGSLK